MNPNENFREKIFDAYGFTFEARAFIRLHSSILVDDPNSNNGGGGWIPSTNSVQLASGQHEAAVHEFSHVWWHFKRQQEPQRMRGLAEALVQASKDEALSAETHSFLTAYVSVFLWWFCRFFLRQCSLP